jgi:predicted transcriptional regulator
MLLLVKMRRNDGIEFIPVRSRETKFVGMRGRLDSLRQVEMNSNQLHPNKRHFELGFEKPLIVKVGKPKMSYRLVNSEFDDF